MKLSPRHLFWMWILLCSAVHGQTGSTTHTVKPGESLARIARSNHCSVDDLAKANGLKLSAMIHPGQKLKLPGKAAAKGSAAPASGAQTALAGKTHTVETGDTYNAIARKYGVSVAALQAANPGVKPTALRPGQTIRLTTAAKPTPAPAPAPVASSPPAPAPAPAPAEDSAATVMPEESAAAGEASDPQAAEAPAEKKITTVMVESEMTFGEFAALHGTDIARLNDLNGLDLASATVLAKGSELYVPAQP